MPPRISVIIATYNRADAIQRAVQSVQAQSLTDWELIVVDDGSTDNSSALIEGTDPRLTLIRQKNSGFVGARNTGLTASKGQYIAFLDDDDEWLPYHLELTVGFLEAHPTEQFVVTELREDFGHGRHIYHYRAETAERYPNRAKQIGSRRFDLPPGETDNYMRAYESKVPIGDWGQSAIKLAGMNGGAFHYSGNIFEHLRWGYLLAVNSLVMRRSAFEKVGLQNTHYKYAADYHYIADLCYHFRANFLNVPTYIKHELNMMGKTPASSHIVTGSRALMCVQDHLRSYEDHFWKHRPDDRELSALRGWQQFDVAQTALQFGEREITLTYLSEARKNVPWFWRAIALQWFVRCLPGKDVARNVYVGLAKGTYAIQQVFAGDISLIAFLHKVMTYSIEFFSEFGF